VPPNPNTGAPGYWETTKNKIPLPAEPPATNWENNPNCPNYNYLYITTIAPFQYDLEYQNALGEWVPYSYASGVNDSANTWAGASVYNPYLQGCQVIPGATYHDIPSFAALETTFSGTGIAMTSDPRSVRFGPWQFLRNSPTEAIYALIRALWDSLATTPQPAFSNYGYGGGQHGLVPDGPGPIDAAAVPPRFLGIPAQSSYYPAQLVRNNQANGAANSTPITGYLDNDGIQRIADSGLFTGSGGGVNPLNSSTGDPFQRVADQPVVLNRPFNSVAEMGYAFRDDPWHSLDFFSAESADSGLLDLFSLHEEPMVTTPGTVVAGARLDLNTQNPSVLAAMLAGTLIDPMNNTVTISTANALNIAKSIIAVTSVTPLVNKDQLVTKLGPAVNPNTMPATITDPLPASDFASTDDRHIKSHREAYVRALADVGQTRTWNLMIDLIAQSGKYPPNAKDLSQFVVEGERRYWLHVAIDRITGQVIAQQLEPVSE
jgi:hypothetical protein